MQDSDLILYLYRYLDLPTAGVLTCCCRRLAQLGSGIYKARTRDRFRIDSQYHDIRLRHDGLESSWLDFYKRLDNAVCGWRGYALDPVTNQFQPYEMEFVIQESKLKRVRGILAEAICREASQIGNITDIRLQDLSGFCRWRGISDAITKVDGRFNA
ncbi:hypothetical protein HDU91_002915 [Kappamyces sp. JEL0680]|nr:hypothetical protein HDU91_002915 [Kappamyces sp. JEL0680]